MTDATELRCPSCRSRLEDGDRFCEQCGARLMGEEPSRSGCRVCGAPSEAIDVDGFCAVCGARERTADDRVELDLVSAAAVSDRGRVHRRNEDAFHLERLGGSGVAVVVCDGISSASAGDVAARTAASAAGRILVRALEARTQDGSAAVLEGVKAARDSVERVPWTTRIDRGMPSCTLVCALCRGGEITVGSVGDSRVYWIDSDGVRQLTVDDSWAEEQVADGALTVEQARADPRSHSITHWIGADAPERPPRITALHAGRRGWLLLCTDGLWNYLAGAGELGALIDALPAGASAAAVARALVDTAVLRGGRDNVTTAVIEINPS